MPQAGKGLESGRRQARICGVLPSARIGEQVERQSSAYELLKNSLKISCCNSMRIGAGGFFGELSKSRDLELATSSLLL